jgi:hypothetical protein
MGMGAPLDLQEPYWDRHWRVEYQEQGRKSKGHASNFGVEKLHLAGGIPHDRGRDNNPRKNNCIPYLLESP